MESAHDGNSIVRHGDAKKPCRGLFKVLTVILIAAVAALAAVASPVAAGGLFRDANSSAEAGRADDADVMRTRLVVPDLDLLHQWGDGGSGARLLLNLFDDAAFWAVLDRVESNPSGSQSWIGRLDGVLYGSVILVVKDGVLMGNISSGDGLYRVSYVGEGVHAIQEMDSAAFPPELEPVTPSDLAAAVAPAPQATADDGSIIDVLVVYTDDARAVVGGTTAMEALIDVAIAETNGSYANSLINQRLNLVGTAELAYNESSFDWYTTLSRLRSDGDGYLDQVHVLRDQTCADEVVLLVRDEDYTACGMAYQMASVSSSFASYAFALVRYSCATGYYSFGHELGHNMGARHDWYVDSATSPYSYCHGFVNATDRWRTIMAYDEECTDGGFNCTRLQYWSNPYLSIAGDPMGVPGGTSTSCYAGVPEPDCDADNHRSLNNTAVTVANFRDSAACGAPATYTISGTVRDGTSEGVGGVTVDFDGARPAVTTASNGSYTQSGFANGDYAVGFSQSETFFSPVLDTVTVSDQDAVHDALATSPLSVPAPMTETFESGALGDQWAVETDYDGRVRVEYAYPHDGEYALLLDSASDPGYASHASAILALDLVEVTDADLSFWWRRLGEESESQDGVYVSDDWGATWHSVLSFADYTADEYRQEEIDLVSAADGGGMVLNDHFLVKFQFYGSDSIPTAGYAIDDVQVTTTPTYSIHGTVRNGSGDGVAGVIVDFDGARPAVTTATNGSYTQSGFANGGYTIGLSRSKTFFSPVLHTVTISDQDAVHDALGISPLSASTPMTETFESGLLGDDWAEETDYEGRVRVEKAYPHGGEYALLLDSANDPGYSSHAAAVLALDLVAVTEADLTFWWLRVGEQDDSEDGVYVSDDWGATWHSVLSFSDYAADDYQEAEIDLVWEAALAGLTLNDHFLVKFQFYGSDPVTTAGYAIDDVLVTSSSLHVYLPLVLMTD